MLLCDLTKVSWDFEFLILRFSMVDVLFHWKLLLGEKSSHILRCTGKESLSAFFSVWTTQRKQKSRAISRMQIWMTVLLFLCCIISQIKVWLQVFNYLEFNLVAFKVFRFIQLRGNVGRNTEAVDLTVTPGQILYSRLSCRKGNTMFFCQGLVEWGMIRLGPRRSSVLVNWVFSATWKNFIFTRCL